MIHFSDVHFVFLLFSKLYFSVFGSIFRCKHRYGAFRPVQGYYTKGDLWQLTFATGAPHVLVALHFESHQSHSLLFCTLFIFATFISNTHAWLHVFKNVPTFTKRADNKSLLVTPCHSSIRRVTLKILIKQYEFGIVVRAACHSCILLHPMAPYQHQYNISIYAASILSPSLTCQKSHMLKHGYIYEHENSYSCLCASWSKSSSSSTSRAATSTCRLYLLWQC